MEKHSDFRIICSLNGRDQETDVHDESIRLEQLSAVLKDLISRGATNLRVRMVEKNEKPQVPSTR